MNIVLPDDWNHFAEEFGVLPRLQALGDVVVYDRPPRDRADLLERLSPADVIISIRERTQLDAETLGALPDLRLIAVTGTGYVNVDTAAATEHGVLVCNSPGRSARSVAELSIALLMASARHLAAADRGVRRGDWSDPWARLQGHDLAGKTLGILGLGNIGPLVAHIALALEMRVLAWSANMTPEHAESHGAVYRPLENLLAESDAVSIHLRLSDRTRNLLGRRELDRLRTGAMLVNTSRGEIVDEPALVEALRAGRLQAAMDVFWREPLPGDHPLLTLDNVILTPHVGSVTEETSRRWVEGAVENVAAYAAGAPANVVNPAALERRATREVNRP